MLDRLGQLPEPLSRALVGSWPGSLAQINVVLSVFFAGISGSSTADAASQSKIFIDAQTREGYDLSFSIAITALAARHAALGLGPIIACHLPAVWLAVVIGATTAAVAAGLRAVAAPGPVVLLAAAAAGGLVFLALGALQVRRGQPDAVWLWSTLRSAVAKRRKA